MTSVSSSVEAAGTRFVVAVRFVAMPPPSSIGTGG
jgi:hypothetical protein